MGKENKEMAELTYSERQAGDVVIVDVQGDITTEDSATRVYDTLRRMLDEGKKKILLNLGGICYVDPSGLRTMVSGFDRGRGQGGSPSS